jgi:RES domain-containing protein
MGEKLLCSECFSNFGLRSEATHIGDQDDRPCENCSSRNGAALDHDGLDELMTRFFVEGSRQPYLPTVYRIDYSNVGKQHAPVRFDETLQFDYELLARRLEVLRYHAPKLRIMGLGGPYSDFADALEFFDQNGDRVNLTRVGTEILKRCSDAFLEPGERIYRIRTNPKRIHDPKDIDTPPPQNDTAKSSGRFDSGDLPVLYASSDVETAIHESRVRLGDEIILGTLEIFIRQKLVDLDTVKVCSEGGRNLNADYHYFLRGRLGSQEPIDYRMLRSLAFEARVAGFDGIKFRSFYSMLRDNNESAVNYALFGYPIKEERLKLKSWNTVRLLKASYDFQFGPLPHTLWEA